MTDIKTPHREYTQLLSSEVTRHLSLIIKDKNINKHHNDDDYDDDDDDEDVNSQIVRSNSFKIFNIRRNQLNNNNNNNNTIKCVIDKNNNNTNENTSNDSLVHDYECFDDIVISTIKNQIQTSSTTTLSTTTINRKITLNEILMKTIPIWYLPSTNKTIIYELLKDKPIGHFIITNNNNNNNEKTTDCCSLILFAINNSKQLTQHLIHIDERKKLFKLNNSKHTFTSITQLIEYYLTNDDKSEQDLNFKLTLPDKFCDTSNLQELTSLALLEQDFWTTNNYFNNNNHETTNSSNLLSLSYASNEHLRLNKKSLLNSSANTSEKDTSSSSSSSLLYLNNTNSTNTNSLKDTIKIDKTLNTIANNNNNNKHISLLQQPIKVHSNDNGKLTKVLSSDLIILRKDNSSNNKTDKEHRKKSQNKDTSSKRYSKSLDEFAWPWRRLQKNNSFINTSSQVNTNTKRPQSNSKQQKQGTKTPNNTSISNISVISNSNNIKENNNNNNHSSKSHLFKSSKTTITNFLSNLFHKSSSSSTSSSASSSNNTTDNNTKPTKTKSERSLLKFNLGKFSNNTKNKTTNEKIPNNKPLVVQQPLATNTLTDNNNNSNSSNNNNLKSNDDKISINSCVTYVNPFFDNSQKSKQTIEVLNNDTNRFDNASSIYSSLDDYDYPYNDDFVESPPSINSSIYTDRTTTKNTQSLTSDEFLNSTTRDNSSISSRKLDYSLSLNNKMNDPNENQANKSKSASYFRRTTSMIEPKLEKIFKRSSPRPTTNFDKNSSDSQKSPTLPPLPMQPFHQLRNTQKVSGEYSEPFDLLTSSNYVVETTIQEQHYSSIVCPDDDSSNREKIVKATTATTVFTETQTPEVNLPLNSKSGIIISDDYECVSDVLKKIEDQKRFSVISYVSQESENKDKTLSITGSDKHDLTDVTNKLTDEQDKSNEENDTNSNDNNETYVEENGKANTDNVDAHDEENDSEDDGDDSVFESSITTYDILNARKSVLLAIFENHTNDSPVDTMIPIAKSDSVKESHKHVSPTYIKSANNRNNSGNSGTTGVVYRHAKHLKERKQLMSDINDRKSLFLNRTINNQPVSFDTIKSYVLALSKNTKSIFGQNISGFLNCINSSTEINPYSLMSNIRQFMNGIKNFLTRSNPDTDLFRLIEAERNNLVGTQILNIDSVIEECLQDTILKQLKAKIYYSLVDWLVNDESLLTVSNNIKKLNEIDETIVTKLFGVQQKLQKTHNLNFKLITAYYEHLQNEYSPIIKLKFILMIINELLSNIDDFSDALVKDFSYLNLNDFIPILIFTIIKCKMFAIQIEIDYIWCLVNRNLLNNETVYYLTIMTSACYIIKCFDMSLLEKCECGDLFKISNNQLRLSEVMFKTCHSEMLSKYVNEGTFKFLIPDEKCEKLSICTIPMKPSMKSKDACNIIASKLKVFQSDDYSLYYLDDDGIERKLRDDEQPLDIRNERIKKNLTVAFVYKHRLANILWPKNILKLTLLN